MNTTTWSKRFHQVVPFVPALLALVALGWFVSVDAMMMVLGTSPILLAAFPGVWWRRSKRPPSAWDDLHPRMPVWSALSELYLDTELQERDHVRIADLLARSGYDVHQLEEILYREVHPAVVGNLLGGFGEWAGFDPEWLARRILRHSRPRWGVALVFAKCVTRAEWLLIRARVATLQVDRPAAQKRRTARVGSAA